jgi:23S rRNA (cytidine2498-2'-O)-methyltransferase
MTSRKSRFLFAVCQAGAEKALKEELAHAHPELRFAFSRPGFVTFKCEEELAEDFELRSVFARAYGLSMGKTPAPAEIIAFAREILGATPERPVTTHLWERELHAPGEEPMGFVPGALATGWRDRLAGEPGSDALHFGSASRTGWPVLDIVVVEPEQAWFGAHLHGPSHSPEPGGVPALELPEQAPSRAWLKLEQGVRWARLPMRKGDLAVEIGSAPGGASFALLERGLEVIGIDPAAMDPRVLSNPRFKHLSKPVASVLREDLPRRVDWLLLDMNVQPQVSLFAVDRLASRLKDSLLGVLLTVKLNDWKLAREIGSWLEHVEAMGVVQARATQLPANRQEICIAGVTRLGAMRQNH